MARDVVIRAEALGKKYLIGHQAQREPYTALRDVLARSARGLVRTACDMLHGRPLVTGDEIEELWALRDVSFEIRRGEAVGIIGRNGAGKSTLLKILSRITEPSEGRVTIDGRVASLLEVGTGFHPELTGRENIYLNGAILGMTQAEIRRKFDEIVTFAEVGKFLDTPVKRFSSGMYVRLAFAVAAHLEPEILVVDEVLAVGDAEFQKKCLGRMQDVTGHGRTVLFVSHNLGAVAALCSRAILLSTGSVAADGPVCVALTAYGNGKRPDNQFADLSTALRLGAFTLSCIENEKKIHATLELKLSEEDILSDLSILLYNDTGIRIAIADLRLALGLPRKLLPGVHRVECNFGPIHLVEGTYEIGLYIAAGSFSGNILGYSKIITDPPTRITAPYPASSRGFFETYAEGRLA